MMLAGKAASEIAARTEAALAATGELPREGKAKALRITGDGSHSIEPSDGARVAIVIEDNATVSVSEEGRGDFSVDILLGENAALTYCAFGDAVRARRTAVLGRDSRITWVDASAGSGESAVTSFLAGEGSSAEYRSALIGKDDETHSVTSRMVHLASRSTSNMLTRAVMLGRSKGRYEGLIRIDPKAAGCDAYQKEDTLLLSPDARMDATPNLEIENEDVRCSHGVSLGRIDEEKLFYFLSRGIPRARAIALIVEGFLGEALGTGELRDRLLARLEATT